MKKIIVTTYFGAATHRAGLARVRCIPYRMFVASTADTRRPVLIQGCRDVRRKTRSRHVFDTRYAVTRGPGLDVTAGAHVTRRWPLPFLPALHAVDARDVERVRTASPTSIGRAVLAPSWAQLQREELGIHLKARGIVASGRRAEVGVLGGRRSSASARRW